MSKLYIALGSKQIIAPSILCDGTQVNGGLYEDFYFIWNKKEILDDFKKSSILKITHIYEIDAKLIDIDEI